MPLTRQARGGQKTGEGKGARELELAIRLLPEVYCGDYALLEEEYFYETHIMKARKWPHTTSKTTAFPFHNMLPYWSEARRNGRIY